MKVIQWIYTIYAALIFIILMLLLGFLILIPLIIHPKGGKISFFFIRIWANTWSFCSGIRYQIEGKEHIQANTPYIYIFNHRSFIDAPVIPIAIPQEIRAIGKKELSKVPLFGLFLSRVAIWVDRKSPESRKKSVQNLLEILQKEISIVVAPEGTRNDTEDTLLPFQKGAFRISVDTGIQILPMAVIGADRIMKRGSILMKPGLVRIYFSAPIDPKPYQSSNDFNGLMEKSYNRLEAMILTHE